MFHSYEEEAAQDLRDLKSIQWDKLREAVYKLYFDEDGNEWPEDKYDLCSIGEVAASHLGFL